MDDWQQELWKKWQKTAADMETFLLEVGEAAESFADEMGETIEDFVEQFQTVVVTEVDSFIQDFLDAIAEEGEVESSLWEDLEDFTEDYDYMGVGFQPPTSEINPACINCVNYHGRIYHGNLLVCGMHPHGWDDEHCPDWEGNK
ncbi:MAG: hypothetical protein ACFCU5_01855 [Pleurocapsa sp.]